MKTFGITLAAILPVATSGSIPAMAHEALVEHANPHESIRSDLLPGIDLLIGLALVMVVTVAAAYWRARRKR